MSVTIKRKLKIFFYIERQSFEFYFICIAVKFVEKYELRLSFDILMYVLLYFNCYLAALKKIRINKKQKKLYICIKLI